MTCPTVMTVHSISLRQHGYTPALIITRVRIPLHCYIKFPVQCPLPSQQISDGKIDFTTAQGSSHVALWLPKHISELLCAKGLSLLIYISFVMGDTSNSSLLFAMARTRVTLTRLWLLHCTIITWVLIFLVVCNSWLSGHNTIRPTCGNV